jgi:hypothetical protein
MIEFFNVAIKVCSFAFVGTIVIFFISSLFVDNHIYELD